MRGQPPPPGCGRKRLDPVVRETFDGLLHRKFGPNAEVLIERATEIASRDGSARDAAVALQAVALLLGYAKGKPVVRQEIAGPGGTSLGIDLQNMTTAELKAHVMHLIGKWPATPPPSAVGKQRAFGVANAAHGLGDHGVNGTAERADAQQDIQNDTALTERRI